MTSMTKRVAISIVAGLLFGAALFVLALSAFLNSSLEVGYLVSLLQSINAESAEVYLIIIAVLLACVGWELVSHFALKGEAQGAS